jgi:hypothetical protein
MRQLQAECRALRTITLLMLTVHILAYMLVNLKRFIGIIDLVDKQLPMTADDWAVVTQKYNEDAGKKMREFPITICMYV